MKSFTKLFSITLLSLIFVVNVAPVYAQTANTTVVPAPYTLLAPLPLDSTGSTTSVNINSYIPNVVKLIIGIAGALAILRIIMGGIKYMTSEAFEGKGNAKETINNAIIGLLLAMSAYVILYTVNPNLVQFNFNITGLSVGTPIGTNLGSTTPQATNPGQVVANAPTGCATACVTPPSNVNQKTQQAGGCASTASVCVIDQTIATKLDIFAQELDALAPSQQIPGWQLTEMFPPQDPNHTDPCHANGTCVDAAFYQSAPLLQKSQDIIKFEYWADAAGLKANYETTSQALADNLKQLGVQNVWYNSAATGEHFHVTIK